MSTFTRRSLLTRGMGIAAGLAAVPSAVEARTKSGFSFVHITDTHIQPELGATEGVRKAFAAVRALPEKPAFALVGGDLVFDAAAVPRERADLVYDLWRQESERLELPLYHSIGNHDLYQVNPKATAAKDDPSVGKGMWLRRLGLERSYDSFDHGGWRFITLDSVGITAENKWEGVLDEAQLRWLDDLLRRTPRGMPIVVLTHFPIFTIFKQYEQGTTLPLPPELVVKNGKAFKEIIQGYNVKAVFQGHTHVIEECTYLGTRYITGGAVCGEWWKGPRLGVHPEGFVVATVHGEELSWRAVAYGWKARPAEAPPGTPGSTRAQWPDGGSGTEQVAG